jgi:RNA polymerase sigma-32 factor
VGLMQAVKRFDPEKGFRLATYAMWWIRAAIQEYILRSWSLVKIGTTAAQKKLFFNLRKAKSKIDALEDGDLHPDQVQAIATKLGVPEQDVINMNRRMSNGGDQSLNAPLRADADGGEWQDWLVDESETAEDVVSENEELTRRREMLHTAMETLNEREMHILTERRLKDEPSTLEELSQEYGISRERVRQIEVRAFEKLQKAMRAAHKDEIRATREKAEEYAS